MVCSSGWQRQMLVVTFILFTGALAYADDIVLLAPNASAMRKILQICDEYAAEFSINYFNANKYVL